MAAGNPQELPDAGAFFNTDPDFRAQIELNALV
jgi:hypothetical protein